MKRRIKIWLTTVLIRLIDEPVDGVDEKIDEWLAMSYQHPGFRAYVQRRGKQLITWMVSGQGQKEDTREEYIRKFGHRLELLTFAQSCKSAYNRGEGKQIRKEQRKRRKQ